MSSAAAKRIAIGTVQFGLAYGIANQTGQVSRAEGAAILDYGRANGLDTLDTASVYGESERRLGEIGVDPWRVVSKLPPIPQSCADVDSWVSESVEKSRDRLGIAKLYGLLLHRPDQLFGAQGGEIYQALCKLKEDRAVEKIGVSVYDPSELEGLCSGFALDLVQAPFNIVDRRIAMSGWLKVLRDSGVEIHLRSAFLQGLLLMDEATRPRQFDEWRPLWKRWHRWLQDEALTPLQACLGFALSAASDRVVVGVDSLVHLKEVVAAVVNRAVVPPPDLMSEDPKLINPSRWNAP